MILQTRLFHLSFEMYASKCTLVGANAKETITYLKSLPTGLWPMSGSAVMSRYSSSKTRCEPLILP